MRKYIKIRSFQFVVVLCAFVCALSVESCSQLAHSTFRNNIEINMYLRAMKTDPDKAGFALLVDVPDYRDANIPSLQAKSREMDEIKDALHLVGGFPEQQIQTVVGENATREGITEALTAIVERTEAQANARFLFYLKGRSLRVQGKNYFLPYDARVGAASTYIEGTTLMNWFDSVPLRMKAFIQATWDVDATDDRAFSTQLAKILRDEKTDRDANRKVTLAEVEEKIRRLGLRGNYPIRIVGNKDTVLVRLPSMLRVRSYPPNATVLLNGKENGVTPTRIVGLTPGIYRLRVKKELHRMSEERTIKIVRTRGQQVRLPPPKRDRFDYQFWARGQQARLPPFQLMPIRIYGTVHDAEKRDVVGVVVRIAGTGYQQTVENDGKFSFENWQDYGLLKLGKTYEVVAQGPGGLYEGKASFTSGGTEDIRLDISLTQRNLIESAVQRLTDGFNVPRSLIQAILSLLEREFQTKADDLQLQYFSTQLADLIPPELAQILLSFLESKLKTEPNNLRWHYFAAQLADLINDIPAAKRHWKAIKANTVKGTVEYKQAIARLQEIDPSRKGWIFVLIAAGLVVLGTIGFYFYRRIHIGEFQEIPPTYIAGKPIREQEMFFGREDVFDFIKDKFSRSTKDITIVLHGGRRTGKTSILYQIANGRLGNEFVPVFIDMQEMGGVDVHDFFRIIAQKVSEVHQRTIILSETDKTQLDELYNRLKDKSESAYQSFNDFLIYTASMLEGKYLIFLIDEYEIIERKVNEGDLSDEIFTYLRHLMQNMDNLAFIFAGSSDFAKRQRKEWALMFNMAQPKEVSFLSTDDVIALITEPVRGFVWYDRKAVDRILRLTAGQPFFTQLICLNIIENLNDKRQNRVTIEYVEEACHEIVENPPYHFAYLWGELTADEKIMIALLAEIISDEIAYASVDDIASILPHYELQYSRADISKTLARLREEHIIEKKPGSKTGTYRFQMDLTRGWIQAEHSIWGVLKEIAE